MGLEYAPFDNIDNDKIQPSGKSYNKTIKKPLSATKSTPEQKAEVDPQLFSELYKKIHANSDDSQDKLATFKPITVGELNNETVPPSSSNTPSKTNEQVNTYTENYYKNSVPYYNTGKDTNNNNNQLLNKLNYIIHLLEDQKDERTNYITEELILYTFLGIFIIFIIDSFARASKYIR